MAYQSQDLDKWLGTLFSDTNTQKWEDPLTNNDLASRYGLKSGSTSTPRYDDFANDLISAARRNGANLSHDRWTQQGLMGALRYASPLASVDAARGFNMTNTNPNAAGEPLYDTSLFGDNGKSRIADFLNTGSLFNRGEYGKGVATALGYQELPNAYKTVVEDIGNKYTAPGMERYANSSGTQFGLEALLNSIYGSGVAGQIANDTLRRGYDRTGNPFTNYYNDLFGGDRNFDPQMPGGNGGGNAGDNGAAAAELERQRLANEETARQQAVAEQARLDRLASTRDEAAKNGAVGQHGGMTVINTDFQGQPSEDIMADMIAKGYYWDPVQRRFRND